MNLVEDYRSNYLKDRWDYNSDNLQRVTNN